MLLDGGRPAGYVDPDNGSSCPLQLFFGWFHSFPLCSFKSQNMINFVLIYYFQHYGIYKNGFDWPPKYFNISHNGWSCDCRESEFAKFKLYLYKFYYRKLLNRRYLHIMSRRNALKEDFSFGRINIEINPFSPSRQSLIVCH